ncbi:MAG: ATPase [Proteobacteria bacterium]|nr:ATPase [Pseudomonadota bacterium]
MNRIYKEVTVEGAGDAYTIQLDGRAIKTPAKSALLLPTRELAKAIAEEWDSQETKIDPASMPLMQAAATAIDRVTPQRKKVIQDIAAYGGTDLVCYRAEYPDSLVAKQSAAWDPLLQWIETRHQITLKTTNSIHHINQEEEALTKMLEIVGLQKDMTLSPLYNITALCGSLVVALAVLDGHVNAEEAFEISELDETHVMEQWGIDAEAMERRKNNKESLAASTRFLELTGIIA